ncbi:MAG: hypothetical protein G8237_10835 [Magnetococcales bacterium]|nr:hypothetical protein [Magnetococcales bacterium]
MQQNEPEHQRLARSIPLMRVAGVAEIESILKGSGAWQVTRDASRTPRDVQMACGWSRCVYFYAGHAIPQYGEIAFAYAPDFEQGKAGHVAPCDSGGVYAGKCDPFLALAGSDPKNPAVFFLQQNRYPLDQWREPFADYLKDYFGNNMNAYCAQQPPNFLVPPAWGDPNLPARFAWNHQQSDLLSWIWEVRIEQPVELKEDLLVWSTSRQVFKRINNQIAHGKLGFNASRNFERLKKIFNIITHEQDDAVVELKDWTRQWLTRQP